MGDKTNDNNLDRVNNENNNDSNIKNNSSIIEINAPLPLKNHNLQQLKTNLKQEDEIKYSNYIMLSHFITRMGDKTFEFMIPLFLIYQSPNSLLPVSLFGLSITTVRIIFGSAIGNICDQYKKIQVIKLGIFGQAISVGSIFVIIYYLLNYSSITGSGGGGGGIDQSLDLFSNKIGTFLFFILLLFSSIHSLSGLLMDISIERKWTPSLISNNNLLNKVNTWMRQIDLGTEVLGPFLVGLLMTTSNNSVGDGEIITHVNDGNNHSVYLLITILNFFSFFPQYILLKIVYDEVSKQNLIIIEDEIDINNISNTKTFSKFTDGLDLNNIINSGGILLNFDNPFSTITKGWRLFYQQSIFLVMISYVMLYLTVLSPHDVLMTAYLSNNDKTTPTELSTFRLLGALFGLGSTMFFTHFVKFLNGNMNLVGQFYIFEEGIMILISGFFYSSISSTNSKNNEIGKLMFLGAIVLSRIGLYGFELSEMYYVQRKITQNRGIISGVESSLTSLATLLVFVISIIFHKIESFYLLATFSVISINFAAILFFCWCKKNQQIHQQTE